MCTRYISPDARAIESYWHIGARTPNWTHQLFPRSHGPFLRRADSTDPAAELVVGQWGLIPHFAKSAKLPYATVNARSEELSQKASYKGPWARGQRCIIPAESFDEPNWESGKNVWWRFSRADGRHWGVAGLWNTWTDHSTGEIIESYTMLNRLDRPATCHVVVDRDECRDGEQSGQRPVGRGFRALRHARSTAHRVLHRVCALLAVGAEFDFEGQGLADGRPTGAGGEGLDVDEDLLPTLDRIDEAEPTLVVPGFEFAVDTHARLLMSNLLNHCRSICEHSPAVLAEHLTLLFLSSNGFSISASCI